jgi:catechol 2,3-dioxygenase-like lactoylglutathione lyase family enzyme
MKNIIKRTTLFVRDMEVSKTWYEDVLGFSVWMDDIVTLSGTGMPAGGAGDKVRLIIMQAEDPAIGMIGLLEWVDPKLPAPKEIPKTVTYGNPTFVASSDNVQEVSKKAQEFGSNIHSGPTEWSIRGQNGKMKKFLGLFLFDPDGYFYEITHLVREE